MGVIRQRRRVIGLAVAALVAVTALAVWQHVLPDERIEIRVFDEPGSFCESFREQTYSAGIEGVTTASDPVHRSEFARLRAEMIRGVARRSGTEPEVATELRRLAHQTEAAADSGRFDGALTTARALDRRATATCR